MAQAKKTGEIGNENALHLGAKSDFDIVLTRANSPQRFCLCESLPIDAWDRYGDLFGALEVDARSGAGCGDKTPGKSGGHRSSPTGKADLHGPVGSISDQPPDETQDSVWRVRSGRIKAGFELIFETLPLEGGGRVFGRLQELFWGYWRGPLARLHSIFSGISVDPTALGQPWSSTRDMRSPTERSPRIDFRLLRTNSR